MYNIISLYMTRQFDIILLIIIFLNLSDKLISSLLFSIYFLQVIASITRDIYQL
jgi:hypothetical protein